MPYIKPNAGQPLATTPIASASFQGDLVDVVDDFNRHRMGKPSAKLTLPIPTDVIKIKNSSPGDRRRGEVLKIGTFSLSDVDRRTLWFNGTVPTETTDTVAVLLEPIKYADTGYFPAQVTGVVPALVDMQTSGDRWAVVDPDSPVLKSATSSGTFPILHAPTGTGEKDCVILLDRSTAPTGVKFRNDSGYTIPRNGVMAVTGYDATNSAYIVQRPSDTFYRRYLVNGDAECLYTASPKTFSNGTWLGEASKVKLSTNSGSIHSEWGAKSGYFEAYPNRPGFHLLESPESIDSGYYGACIQREVTELIGKPDVSVPLNSSANVAVWFGLAGSEAVSEYVISCYSLVENVGLGLWCNMQFRNGNWYIYQTECG